MKMILTSAATADEYVACWPGWQRGYVQALRDVVVAAAPLLDERVTWGHLVYFRKLTDGPVLLIRAEPQRVLFGFWRGQRLRHVEPRLKPGGKYEMATLELRPDTPFERSTAIKLVREAVALGGEGRAVRTRTERTERA